MRFLLIFIAFTCLQQLRSQENSAYERYYLMPFIINPATAGSDYYPSSVMTYRKQWTNMPDAPNTMILAGQLKVGNFEFYNPKKLLNKTDFTSLERVGLGACLYADNEGPVSHAGSIMAYAFHVPVNHYQHLSLGISAVFNQDFINNSKFIPYSKDDAYLYSGSKSEFHANINIGAYFYETKYFVGLSANRLLPQKMLLINKASSKPSYFAMFGYRIGSCENNLCLEPSVTLKKIGYQGVRFDVQSKLYFMHYNWLAISYGYPNGVTVTTAFKVYKKYYVGYSYEVAAGEVSTLSAGSSEFILGLNLGLRDVEGIRDTK